MGKTTFAMNVLLRSAAAGKRVLFISADMDVRFFVLRLLAMHSQVSLNRIRQDRLSADEVAAVKAGVASLMKLPIVVLDAYKRLAWGDLLGRTEKLMTEHSIDLFIFDSLLCFKTPSLLRKIDGANPWAATTALRILAERTGSSGIIVCGMNRDVEHRKGRTPKVTDVRGGKRLTAMFDSLLFVERPDPADRSYCVISGREYELLPVHHIKMDEQQKVGLVLLPFCQYTLRILGGSE
jgi:replicative DNA helicase